MTRPRDTQRSRLYAAESGAFEDTSAEQRLETMAEVQEFLDTEVQRVLWSYGIRRAVWATDGRGRRRACGDPGGRIRLPRWSRVNWIVLHEVAHTLQPLGTAWHGPEFCGIYRQLVWDVMGPYQATRLEDALAEHHVSWTRPTWRKVR